MENNLNKTTQIQNINNNNNNNNNNSNIDNNNDTTKMSNQMKYDTNKFEYTSNSFQDMNLKEDVLKGIYNMGLENPSEIQKNAIIPISRGIDILIQAQSGTGKTVTFSVGLLNQINNKLNICQGLILSPTRELSQQIYNVISNLAHYMNIKIHLCVGGTSVKNDISIFKDGVHVVIGTPGRTYDMITRKVLNSDYLKVIILDEADEILSKCFKEQIKEIFKYVPKNSQVVLASATITNEVIETSEKILQDPIKILKKNNELTLEGIQQYFIYIENDKNKLPTLIDLYDSIMVKQSIIFCNNKIQVDNISNKLREQNFTVSCIHGEMKQELRDQIMNNFREGSSRILITTDLLGRGIDIQQVSLVINYDLPFEKEKYIHRVGRGGRYGRKSIALSFVTTLDIKILKDIEHFYNTEIPVAPENIESIIKDNL